jgi:hypothetical protein
MRLLILGLCLFAVGCAGEVPGLSTSPSSTTGGAALTQAASGANLPFHGSLDGAETAVPHPPTIDVQSTGGGEATHLGRFTATFHALVTLPAGTAVGEFTFVAANGARLFATFTGQSAPTSVADVVSIQEIATITGGTGRFEDATGSFTIDRLLNQVTHISSGSFSGTIDLND